MTLNIGSGFTVVTIPALFAIVGLLIFCISKIADAKEAGRIMFFCGLLVTLLRIGIK